MEPYNFTMLQWEPLGRLPSTTTGSSFQTSLEEHLSSKPWLLAEGQSLQLPKSHIEKCNERLFSVASFVRYVDSAAEKDVFASAVDDQGNLRKLSREELREVWRTGQFTVASKNFENQSHVWRVARSFYSGTETNLEQLQKGTGKALDHLVVGTQDAATTVSNNWLSKPSWLGSIKRGFLRAFRLMAIAFTQLLVGAPKPSKYTEDGIDCILKEAELGFIQTELRNRGLDTGLLRLIDDRRPDPRTFQEIWYALQYDVSWDTSYRRELVDIEKVSQDSKTVERWYSAFQLELDARQKIELPVEFQKSLVSPVEARKEAELASTMWRESASEKWIQKLLSDASYDRRLAVLEANRQRSILLEAKLQEEDDIELERRKKEKLRQLADNHPLLSLSEAWQNRRISRWEKAERAALEATRVGRCVDLLKEHDLTGEATVRELQLQFQKTHRETLHAALTELKMSFSPAIFEIAQLNPNNGSTKTVEVDLDNPFWRLKHTWLVCVQATKSIIGSSWFFLTAGPLSLRALLARNAYYAVESPTMHASSYTATLRSRLKSFWDELAAVRERFERSPDTGLIGKSIQRCFLQIYLVVKGVMGTALISSFMVLGTVVTSVTCGLLIGTAPILGVMASTFVAFINVFIFDFALAGAYGRVMRSSCRNALSSGSIGSDLPSAISPIMKLSFGVPYLALFPGLAQATLASVRGLLWHPVIGAITLSLSTVRWCFRSIRDSCTWVFVARYGRVPASETFLASRISGPGVAQSYFYRLPLNAAKENFGMLLDVIRLEAHSQVRAIELDVSSVEYEKFFRELCQPFSVSTNVALPRPSELAISICKKIEANDSSVDSRAEEFPIAMTQSGVWATLAQRIRSKQYDFDRQLNMNRVQTWENQNLKHRVSIEDLDIQARSIVERYFRFAPSLREVDNETLRQMIVRPAVLLATWNLQAGIRGKTSLRAGS